jgi:hypothetical protein
MKKPSMVTVCEAPTVSWTTQFMAGTEGDNKDVFWRCPGVLQCMHGGGLHGMRGEVLSSMHNGAVSLADKAPS